MKLTKAMKEQLLAYVQSAVDEGWYYGNKEQFYARHEKIVEWIKEQEEGK
jgi:hypothetical protein